jgi:hypothetical protein
MLLETDLLPVLENTLLRNEIELGGIVAFVALALDWFRELKLLLNSFGIDRANFALEGAN